MTKVVVATFNVVVAMSGGVDSSVALILLKKQGFEPIGVTLKLPVWGNKVNACRDNVYCTPESIKIAEAVCKKLQVPYFVVDAQKEFKKEVINYFVKELKKYHTPNPCVICNRNLKFQLLIKLADKMKIPYVATGHYAKIKFNKKTCLYELLKGKDKKKDQSYSLSFLTQEQLKHIILPLGNYTKAEVYKIAKKEGFPFFEKIKQSQNFCFVSDKALPLFIQKEIGENSGPIMDMKGNILGQHKGLYFFTLGQRKGLNLPNGPAFAKPACRQGRASVVRRQRLCRRRAGKPYYVQGFDASKNALIITKDKKDLYKKEAILSPLNLISGKINQKKLKVSAKIRYRSKSALATLYLLSRKNLPTFGRQNLVSPCPSGRRGFARNKAKIVFNKPQKAITPGQFCVFYQGNICLGAGVIQKII